MINSKLNVNKAFIEQVDTCINNTFGPITIRFISDKSAKNKASVLALLMFYERRKILSKLSKYWVVLFIP